MSSGKAAKRRSGGDVVELLNNLLGRRQPVRLLEIIQQFNNVPVLFDGD